MIKKLAFLATGVLASYATAAANAVVWNTDGNGSFPPYGAWYSYANLTTDKGNLSVGTDKSKVFSATVSTTNDQSAAGFGFNWAAKDAAVSLADYSGLCLTYKSTRPMKMDLKQSTIKDYNYNGYILPAHSTMDTLFVPFSELKQEDWGDDTKVVAFDPDAQTGVQFSYKKALAAEAKSGTNSFTISSVVLGSSCTTHAPSVTKGFAGYNGGTISLNEGDEHVMDMTEVFEDADGDDFTVTVKIVSADTSVILVDSTAYDQNSIIKFTTTPNPKGSAKVTLTATDASKKSGTFQFTIETIDTDNLPVAKNCEIPAFEDSVLKVGLTSPLQLSKMGSDADGDAVKLIIVSEPKHGTFKLDNESRGTFTYTPDPDFYGLDSIAYKFVEAGNEDRESNVGYAVIKVANVNDKPVITLGNKVFVDANDEEHAFGDTLTVDEDFEKFQIVIAEEDFVVTDVDGEDDFTISATANVVNATYSAEDGLHVITIAAKKDSNGVAKLNLTVKDPGSTTNTLVAIIKVNPVADPPTAVDDMYDVLQDSLNTIAVKKGVLANDLNPDKDPKLTVVLTEGPEHGKLVLNKDGSFTYEVGNYEGPDAFAYKIIGTDDVESNEAVVELNVKRRNHAPAIVEGVLDTVSNRLAALKEDFTTVVSYKKAEMQTWFVDDSTVASKFVFSARSEDSLLNVSVNATTGILSIRSVKDACGDAVVYVTVKDERGATTDLPLQASIACVNDKPVATFDTVYMAASATTLEYDVTKLAYDVDGDDLNFDMVVSAANTSYFNIILEGNALSLEVKDGATLSEGASYEIGFKVSDPTMAGAASPTYVTSKLRVVIGDDPRQSVKPVIATPRANWQNAILANRGVAAMFDMQGRVMWKQKLPVSEAEVRAAASSIQGRKILQVNKQTYTIK